MGNVFCIADIVKYFREAYPKATRVTLAVVNGEHSLKIDYHEPDKYGLSMKTLDGNWAERTK